MKTALKNRSDIEKLVNAFYNKIKTDDKIGYFFTDVTKVNWEAHLAIMYDFWENILFYNGNYSGNPMLKHKEINQKSEMNKIHFQHWVLLFEKTVDELFIGVKAEEVKKRAANIASAMMFKSM